MSVAECGQSVDQELAFLFSISDAVTWLVVEQVAPLPKCASMALLRGLPHFTARYAELAKLYPALDLPALTAFVSEHAEAFAKVSSERGSQAVLQWLTNTALDSLCLLLSGECSLSQDQNMGLVKQVLKSVVHARIRRLTKVYITLSLAEVARQAGLGSAAEAVAEILVMVRGRLQSCASPQRSAIGRLLLFWWLVGPGGEGTRGRVHQPSRGSGGVSGACAAGARMLCVRLPVKALSTAAFVPVVVSRKTRTSLTIRQRLVNWRPLSKQSSPWRSACGSWTVRC